MGKTKDKQEKQSFKRSEGLQLKETKWQEQLKSLFEFAQSEAMNIITKTKNFFLHREKQAAWA